MEATKMETTKMGTTKMGTTKKSATKPSKWFLGARTKRMTSRSPRNKLKKKVIATRAPKPEPIIPRMRSAQLVKVMLRLIEATLSGPNKSLSVALRDLVTAADDLLVTVFLDSLDLARCCDRAAGMDTVMEWIYTVVKMLNNTEFGFSGMLARGLADTDSDDADSDGTDNEVSQSMTTDNGMDDALQSNEAPAAHDNATSECNLMDGDNDRTKRRKIILRVGSRNSHAAI